MMAGIGVVAAPAVVLGVGGYALLARRNRNKLKQVQEVLLQEALRKHDAIIRHIQKETTASRERVEYLAAINAKLADVIQNLRQDLDQEAA